MAKLARYNGALLVLGQERLASLAEASTARYALDDAWDEVVALCLEQGFWNFAMRSVQLASSNTIDPSFGYSYAVEKPTDWVRTHSFSASESFTPPLLQLNDEAGVWYVNVDPLFVRYVSNSVYYGLDQSKWPQTFNEYVDHRLAFKTCKRITGSAPDDDLKAREKKARSDALAKDAMNEPPQFPPTGTWVNSRAAGSVNGVRWDRQQR